MTDWYNPTNTSKPSDSRPEVLLTALQETFSWAAKVICCACGALVLAELDERFNKAIPLRLTEVNNLNNDQYKVEAKTETWK